MFAHAKFWGEERRQGPSFFVFSQICGIILSIMSAKVICVTNQKGGVGKTTTAVNLSYYLAKDKKKTLLVDFDPQGNATSGLGIEKTDKDTLGVTMTEVVLGAAGMTEAIRPTKYKNFDLAPATPELANAEVEITSQQKKFVRLRDAIRTIAENYDYVIIDLPPSLSLLTVNGMIASNYLLLPVQTEFYALEGVAQLLESMKLVMKQANPHLKLLGVLATMYDKRTSLSSQVYDEIKKYFKQLTFGTTIPQSLQRIHQRSIRKDKINMAKGLGRGFESLIPTELIDEEFDITAAEDKKGSELKELKLTDIIRDEDQPRHEFSQEAIEALAASIKEHGVLQPIVVTKEDGKYKIVAGERRWRASKIAGLDKIPAIIRTLDSQNRLELSIIENAQREDLNAIELATAYAKLKTQFNLSSKDIAAKVGKSEASVQNTMRLLNLPDDVKKIMVKEKLSEGVMRPLVSADEKTVKSSTAAIKRDAYRKEEDALSAKYNSVARITGRSLTFRCKTEDDLKALIKALSK